MKVKSLKVNMFFSAFNMLINLAFPLITFPYLSRVLLPDGIGQYSFVLSIVTYFMMFGTFGITIYATKKASQVQSSDEEKSRLLSELFFFNMITSAVAVAFYLAFILLEDKASENLPLYLIIGINIIANFFELRWYFNAKEKFAYNAIRNLIVKTACVVLIYLFVKSLDDLLVYSLIMSATFLIYCLINFAIFVKKENIVFKNLNILKHFIPILPILLIEISSSINAHMDVLMLGYFIDDNAVGQYVAAGKITTMTIDILKVLNIVILPRLSFLISQGKTDEVKNIIVKTFKMLFLFAIPACIGLFFTADSLILVISGELYTSAITTSQTMALNVITVAMANLFGIQILLSHGKVKQTTISYLVAVFINVGLNLILIPKYSFFGASIASVISNFAMFAIQAFFIYKYLPFNIFNKDNFKVVIASVVMTATLVLFNIFFVIELAEIVYLAIKIILAMAVYGVVLLAIKHELLTSNIKKLLSFSYFKK